VDTSSAAAGVASASAFESRRRKVQPRLKVALLVASLLASVGAAATAANARVAKSAAGFPEVLAYGHQYVGYGKDPSHDTFAIFSYGTGTTARGSFSVWEYSDCGGRPCHLVWVTDRVTCVNVVAPNHVIVTGTTTYLGQKLTMTADAVHNSSPSGNSNPDQVRFSTWLDGGAGGCRTPGLGPINIIGGDIQVQNT
jgi:hypothetical protein